MPRYIKQWGLKRTGTNYLRWLIETNFQDVKVLVDVLGWKHGPPQMHPFWNPEAWFPEWKPTFAPVTEIELEEIKGAYLRDEIGHIMIVKNPYAWIDSMARYHKTSVGACGNHTLNMWTSGWNMTCFAYTLVPGLIIKYEDLLTRFEPTMYAIADYYKLKGKLPDLQDSRRRFERGHDGQRPEACAIDQTLDRDYYVDQGYLDRFTPDQREVVASLLSQDLLQRFGYVG